MTAQQAMDEAADELDRLADRLWQWDDGATEFIKGMRSVARSLRAPIDPPRVVITMEGGIIQNHEADARVDVLIMDFDTEGADESDLAKNDQGDAFYWRDECATVDPENVERCYSFIPEPEPSK